MPAVLMATGPCTVVFLFFATKIRNKTTASTANTPSPLKPGRSRGTSLMIP